MNKKYTLALIALCSMGGTYAQSLTQAKQWFEEGKFAEAKPVFQKLVKQAPSNANYNFWYGACCYETGELQESQPYLEKSAARKVINAYLYLGNYIIQCIALMKRPKILKSISNGWKKRSVILLQQRKN